MRTALTIAGSDSIAGAGIQADLKTFAALGVYGVSAVTAVTAQNTDRRRRHRRVVRRRSCARKSISVAQDVEIAAVKTGMLATADNRARSWPTPSSRLPAPESRRRSGHGRERAGMRTLLAPEAVSILKTRLLPLATVVTPNVAEAAALSGIQVDSLSQRARGGKADCRAWARPRSSSRAGT